jgi:hypothetical protein
MSADSNTAIVGGFGDNSATGAAWVYTRTNGVWTQQGSKLVGTGAVGAASQGYSVSLSGVRPGPQKPGALCRSRRLEPSTGARIHCMAFLQPASQVSREGGIEDFAPTHNLGVPLWRLWSSAFWLVRLSGCASKH